MGNVTRRQFVAGAVGAGGYFLVRRRFASLSWADASYTVGTAGTCAVTGTVSYDGRTPKPVMRPITQDQPVAGKAPRVWEGLTLAGKVVQDAIVVINGVATGKPFAEKRHLAYAKGASILDRSDVFGLDGAQTTLEVENRDPILHSWILWKGNQTLANVAHVPGAPPQKVTIKKPGLYELRCAPHPWERGFRMVVPHPYYARTDAKGKFTIDGLPAGSYTAVVWAEGFEPVEMPITVAGASTAFSATLKEGNLGAALKGNLT